MSDNSCPGNVDEGTRVPFAKEVVCNWLVGVFRKEPVEVVMIDEANVDFA